MNRKIIGVTVGTPTSPSKIEQEIKPVKTINEIEPDENGNVEIDNSGSNITLDDELSLESENPVKNKVVTQEFRAFGEAAGAFNERLTSLEQSGVGGGEYEIPTFNLAALGLPSIAPNGEYVMAEFDTTELMGALDKGAVKFVAQFNMGAEVSATLVLNPAYAPVLGGYSCTSLNDFEGILLITTVSVSEGFIAAKCTPMDDAIGGGTTQPTAIDLSGFNTNGTIIETYADGTSKTTTVEFDANGTPTKITDGDGNVTTLTW